MASHASDLSVDCFSGPGSTCPSEPSTCPNANKVVTCTSSTQTGSASISACLPSTPVTGLTTEFSASPAGLTVNADGSFTCPTSGGPYTITARVKLAGVTGGCYSYTVTVNVQTSGR